MGFNVSSRCHRIFCQSETDRLAQTQPRIVRQHSVLQRLTTELHKAKASERGLPISGMSATLLCLLPRGQTSWALPAFRLWRCWWRLYPSPIHAILMPAVQQTDQNSGDIAERLLAHYDVHARTLPWRKLPGQGFADPYHVWLSEIMLQQTTVAAVGAYFRAFTQTWPNFAALAAADDADVMAAWAGLGYYARARNLLKCARVVVSEYQGQLPSYEADLLKLPGIGPYTAAAIAAIAFGRRAVVVDANVERVVSRLFAISTSLPQAKPAIRAATDSVTPELRAAISHGDDGSARVFARYDRRRADLPHPIRMRGLSCRQLRNISRKIAEKREAATGGACVLD
jgi:A/G-specific adenine glycosylase